jgi:hypothetical protein
MLLDYPCLSEVHCEMLFQQLHAYPLNIVAGFCISGFCRSNQHSLVDMQAE